MSACCAGCQFITTSSCEEPGSTHVSVCSWPPSPALLFAADWTDLMCKKIRSSGLRPAIRRSPAGLHLMAAKGMKMTTTRMASQFSKLGVCLATVSCSKHDQRADVLRPAAPGQWTHHDIVLPCVEMNSMTAVSPACSHAVLPGSRMLAPSRHAAPCLRPHAEASARSSARGSWREAHHDACQHQGAGAHDQHGSPPGPAAGCDP